ncbi:carbohydrate kinase family protein [Kaarinaea lacus]
MGISGTTAGSPLIFGEVLFDCFPDGSAVLGGAPFNVAWHLHGLGLAPLMITAIGDDEHGRLVIDKMGQWGMDTSAVQTSHTYPTGQVTVSFNDGEPSYDIVPDQAYDHVNYEPLKTVVQKRAHALLYHGTLVMRTEHTKQHIAALVNDCQLPVFVDVNLRAPWWQEQDVRDAINRAKWVKLNVDELALVTGKNIQDEPQLRDAAQALYDSHDMELLIVTLGAKGAVCLHKQGFVHGHPVPVDNLVDTVGAGDSFSAVMIAGILQHWPIQQTLDKALAFASAVCQMRGATGMDRSLYQDFLGKDSRS